MRSTTTVPTPSTANCAQVDASASPVPAGTVGTLEARNRTPISVVARYSEHLDVFAVDG